jgi:hypothetical protein
MVIFIKIHLENSDDSLDKQEFTDLLKSFKLNLSFEELFDYFD